VFTGLTLGNGGDDMAAGLAPMHHSRKGMMPQLAPSQSDGAGTV